MSYYSRALQGKFFRHDETLSQFLEILSIGDAIWLIPVPLGVSAFMKGGSIDASGFHAVCTPGGLVFNNRWVFFSFTINWHAPAVAINQICAARGGKGCRGYRNAERRAELPGLRGEARGERPAVTAEPEERPSTGRRERHRPADSEDGRPGDQHSDAAERRQHSDERQADRRQSEARKDEQPRTAKIGNTADRQDNKGVPNPARAITSRR